MKFSRNGARRGGSVEGAGGWVASAGETRPRRGSPGGPEAGALGFREAVLGFREAVLGSREAGALGFREAGALGSREAALGFRWVFLTGCALCSALVLWSPGASAETPRSGQERSAGSAAPRGADAEAVEAAKVEKERTEADGEKSYQFQAIEVEGRLKAPQILYFLRRVRAELRAGRLGHRSFLPELADTRRSAALR